MSSRSGEADRHYIPLSFKQLLMLIEKLIKELDIVQLKPFCCLKRFCIEVVYFCLQCA